MRYGPLSLLLTVAACGGTMPEIHPVPLAASAADSPSISAYEAGKSHLKGDRVGLAIIMFEKALAYDPLSVAALNGIGAAYDELRRPDVARMYYSKALALEPNSADTVNNMAVSAAMAGDEATAHLLFARAADLDPANSTIRGNMQVAGMTPPSDLASLPDEDANRPLLERTGLAEVTLTIPPSAIETQPLPAPIARAKPPIAIVVERAAVPAMVAAKPVAPTTAEIWGDFGGGFLL